MRFLPSSERIFFTVSGEAGHCDFITASQRMLLWDQGHFRWLLRLRVLSLMSWCSLCIMTIKLFGVSLDSFMWLLFSAVGENYFIKKHSPTGKLTLSRLEYIWNSQVYRPGNELSALMQRWNLSDFLLAELCLCSQVCCLPLPSDSVLQWVRKVAPCDCERPWVYPDVWWIQGS